MKHWFVDDWKIDNRTGYIDCLGSLFPYITIHKLTPQLILFDLVSCKSVSDFERNHSRYQKANTDYPMIVSPMPNPHNRLYRLIDGKHRLDKLQKSGHKQGFFYIIPADVVLNFVTWLNYDQPINK